MKTIRLLSGGRRAQAMLPMDDGHTAEIVLYRADKDVCLMIDGLFTLAFKPNGRVVRYSNGAGSFNCTPRGALSVSSKLVEGE